MLNKLYLCWYILVYIVVYTLVYFAIYFRIYCCTLLFFFFLYKTLLSLLAGNFQLNANATAIGQCLIPQI